MPNDFIRCDHISTDRLIAELERRQREEPGSWTAQQELRIKTLAEKLHSPKLG